MPLSLRSAWCCLAGSHMEAYIHTNNLCQPLTSNGILHNRAENILRSTFPCLSRFYIMPFIFCWIQQEEKCNAAYHSFQSGFMRFSKTFCLLSVPIDFFLSHERTEWQSLPHTFAKCESEARRQTAGTEDFQKANKNMPKRTEDAVISSKLPQLSDSSRSRVI